MCAYIQCFTVFVFSYCISHFMKHLVTSTALYHGGVHSHVYSQYTDGKISVSGGHPKTEIYGHVSVIKARLEVEGDRLWFYLEKDGLLQVY